MAARIFRPVHDDYGVSMQQATPVGPSEGELLAHMSMQLGRILSPGSVVLEDTTEWIEGAQRVIVEGTHVGYLWVEHG